MTNATWAICVIKDLKNALDGKRYEVARAHLNDAAAAIIARDATSNVEAAQMEREMGISNYGMEGTTRK